MLPRFTGIAVHDGFKPYRNYTNVRHALCNIHHLRELLGVIEQQPDDPRQAWAVRMDRLLRDLHATVQRAREAGEDWLEPSQLAGYRAAYQQIITLGHQTNPAGVIPTGKRGVIRQTPARNLLVRLDRDREHVLRFAHDLRVPFDNNQAERDLRMLKVQQKVSGSFRSAAGAAAFSRIRGYLSTLNKQGVTLLAALETLFIGEPLYPSFA